MLRSRWPNAKLVVGRAKRDRKPAHVRQRLPGCAAEPKKRSEVQFVSDADPNHATARLFGERHRYRDVARSMGASGLELNVANYMAPRKHKIIAMSIKL